MSEQNQAEDDSASPKPVSGVVETIALTEPSRVPPPGLILFAVAVVVGAVWVVTELLSTKTQGWGMKHPVVITLGTGVILLVLTVLGVERWLAWNESRRWRAPALAALNALATSGLAVRGRLQTQYLKLAEVKDFDYGDSNIPVRDTVQMMMNTRRFHRFEEVVRDEMVELATVGMLAIQTVARYEKFAHFVPTISSFQERLGTLAEQADYLFAWSVWPQSQRVTSSEQAEEIHDTWVSDAEAAADRMEDIFFEFHEGFASLRSQLLWETARGSRPKGPETEEAGK